MADVNMDTIIDQLSNLTVMQIADLTKKLEEKWGVKAAPVMAMGGGGGGAAAAPAEAAAEKTEFTVILANARGNKTQVIKAIREITNLGLKDAKDLVDGAPKEVKAGVNKTEAQDIEKKLKEAGAEVELK